MQKQKRRAKTKAWLKSHIDDEFVQRAQREGFRSRAVYKLKEIDEKDRLLGPGLVVVELGAAPGGWSQYASNKLSDRGRLIAMDILPMEPLKGVEFLQGDFTEEGTLKALLDRVGGRRVDLVLSDLAPNISGIASADQAKAVYLTELALDFAAKVLKPGGQLLAKTFQGEGFPELRKSMQAVFKQVISRKPKASRSKSKEIYLLGKGYRSD